MYAGKSRGGDRVERFEPEMLTSADTRTELVNDLRLAVPRGELELRFQPIVDLADGRPRAVEALARWRHPRRGLLGPGAFIGLAEQSGLINELGRWIIDEACREAATWPGGASAPKVTVNVSSAPAARRPARGPRRGRARAPRPAGVAARARGDRVGRHGLGRRDAGRRSRRCAGSASASRSTTSAPATRRSATSPAPRSTCSSSTAPSSPASTRTPSRPASSAA